MDEASVKITYVGGPMDGMTDEIPESTWLVGEWSLFPKSLEPHLSIVYKKNGTEYRYRGTMTLDELGAETGMRSSADEQS